MSWLDFDEAGHVYRVDGRVIPSVTQILEPLYDWSGIPRPILQAAAERGAAVHKACELYDLELLDESSLDDEVAAYLEGWKRFREDTGFIPERVEARVYSARWGYAGTVDRTGRLKRKHILLDIKSGQVSPVTGPQTAAYAEALTEMSGDKFVARYGLYLRPNDYRLVPYDTPTDWLVFQSALNLATWRKNNAA